MSGLRSGLSTLLLLLLVSGCFQRDAHEILFELASPDGRRTVRVLRVDHDYLVYVAGTPAEGRFKSRFRRPVWDSRYVPPIYVFWAGNERLEIYVERPSTFPLETLCDGEHGLVAVATYLMDGPSKGDLERAELLCESTLKTGE